MSDNEAKVKITGDASGAESAMAKAAIAVTSGVTTMREGFNALTSVFGSLQSKMLIVASVLAAGKAFEESVDKVVELNGEAMQLANALGESAAEANVLNTALGNVFLDKDTYLTGVRQLTKALNTNEDAFKKLGVATRDSKGELLPVQQILSQSVSALNEFKAGTDRNTMSQQIFGKNYADVLKLAKLTPEVMTDAKEEIAQYHKELDPAAVLKYKAAMENVGDVFEGVQVTLGKVVMPVFTELGEWFSGIGPSLVDVFSEALNILKIAFDAVKIVAVTLYSTLNSLFDFVLSGVGKAFGGETLSKLEFFKNMLKVVELAVLLLQYAIEQFANVFTMSFDILKNYVGVFADVVLKTLQLDFSGAKAAWEKGFSDLDNVVLEHAQKAAELNKQYADKANVIAMPTVSAPEVNTDIPGGPGSKNAFDIGKKEDTKTRTGDWAMQLDTTKQAYELQNNLRKYDIQQEIDYWNQRLAQATAGSKEYQEVNKKLNDAKLKQAQEAQKQSKDLSNIEIERIKSAASSQLAIDEENAKALLDLGQITHAQYIEMSQAFEDRRYEIAKAALARRLELVLADPNSSPADRARINAELEALEQDHGQKLNEIAIARTKESMQIWTDLSNSMSNLWDKGLDAMMNGTFRWANAYKAVLAEVGKVFVNFAAQKARAWLQTEVLQTVYTRVQTLVRTALEKAGLMQSVASTATAATAKVGANAAVAGSGAASAMASIPYVGPVLAIAAMAAMLASVGSLKGSIKSARNGYDIPAGINPVVQLHEQEMVLPKAQADAVRDLASGGGGANSINVHINAVDANSVKKFFIDNSPALADALRKQFRNGGGGV